MSLSRIVLFWISALLIAASSIRSASISSSAMSLFWIAASLMSLLLIVLSTISCERMLPTAA